MDIVILESPSNLGLREPSPGREPGVRKLPAWLKAYGFHQRIRPAKTIPLTPPPYTMDLDETARVRNADAIVRFAAEQAAALQKLLNNRLAPPAPALFPLVLGGDCSILIGNALALKKMGRYGLFFLDGHTDFMHPSFSQTGGAAGMDLSIVTGHAHQKLADIDGQGPYIREEDVWCVGNREYDAAYVRPILDSRIHYYDLANLRRVGVKAVVDAFIEQAQILDGFWIHLDVDVLDNVLMPAVDSPQPDGLSYEELDVILRSLLSQPKAAGLELTILDPDLDPDGRYTTAFVDHFCDSFLRGLGKHP
jgi:arginase